MFYDLCLQGASSDVYLQRERMAMAVRLGYDCVAVAHQAKDRLTEQDRCSIEPFDEAALAAAGGGMLDALQFRRSLLKTAPAPGQLQQLTRLTVSAEDASNSAQAFSTNSPILASYDILAVQPLSERVMHQACTSLDVDIIALDMSRRMPFKFRPATIKAALSRGIHFEICYSTALRDDSARRNLFSHVAGLVRATRGQGIVVSSGARAAFDLRGPYDVLNLATLFGLHEGHAKAALTSRCQAVVEHARLRKAYKGAIRIDRVPLAAAGSEPGAAADPGSGRRGSQAQAQSGGRATPGHKSVYDEGDSDIEAVDNPTLPSVTPANNPNMPSASGPPSRAGTPQRPQQGRVPTDMEGSGSGSKKRHRGGRGRKH